jgi:pilus assembly protein FimV
MGGINVTSGLGERLKADIDLVAVTKAEKPSLVARLASPDTYKNAGLEYPHNNRFKFDIASRANGDPYLNVTSVQPVNDPFVVVMVELNWASGRLVREYTFLLDPPGYVAEQPSPANVEAVEPVVQVATEPVVAEPEVPDEAAAAEPVATEPVAEEPVPVAAKSLPERLRRQPMPPQEENLISPPNKLYPRKLNQWRKRVAHTKFSAVIRWPKLLPKICRVT